VNVTTRFICRFGENFDQRIQGDNSLHWTDMAHRSHLSLIFTIETIGDTESVFLKNLVLSINGFYIFGVTTEEFWRGLRKPRFGWSPMLYGIKRLNELIYVSV
jgi:hypothetical protein